jgi:hypothetical protein
MTTNQLIDGIRAELEGVSGEIRKVAALFARKSSPESGLQEAVDEMAENLKKSYDEWPEGHEMYTALPGALACLVSEVVDLGYLKERQVSLLLDESYAKAGHTGHPHIEQVARIYAELERVL